MRWPHLRVPKCLCPPYVQVVGPVRSARGVEGGDAGGGAVGETHGDLELLMPLLMMLSDHLGSARLDDGQHLLLDETDLERAEGEEGGWDGG